MCLFETLRSGWHSDILPLLQYVKHDRDLEKTKAKLLEAANYVDKVGYTQVSQGFQKKEERGVLVVKDAIKYLT